MLQEFTLEVEKTAQAAINNIHTALPGRISSFDAGSCTASVSICGKYVTNTGKAIAYPQMNGVPVVFPSCASGIGVAYPIKPGDGCIVIISEVELDTFKTGSQSVGSLRYDMSNALCIPGLLSKNIAAATEAQNKNAVVVDGAGTKIVVNNSLIEMTGNVKINGKLDVTEDVKAGNISLKNHVHSYSGGTTGKPS